MPKQKARHRQTAVRKRRLSPKENAARYTSIQEAIGLGDHRLVQDLLQDGVDPNYFLQSGFSLLHLAVAVNRERCVRMLLEHGAHPHVGDRNRGYTPLHIAATCGQIRIARLILGHENCYQIANATSDRGLTPLHVATATNKNSIQMITLLVEGGAEVNAATVNGDTPLSLVVRSEKRRVCAKQLLEKGADVDAQQGFPLCFAVLNNDNDLVRLLLVHGANVNFRGISHGHTPLHLSVVVDNLRATQLLYEFGAEPYCLNQSGKSALQLAELCSRVARDNHPCYTFLQERSRSPRTLQEICRLYIRRILGKWRLQHINDLPLTKVMIQFLNHE
ncbi:ankyrin repeat and SOCS box protein 7-like [Branchiostoma floridae]|uniref:Ankyrin repeat and SOCS box protein 7-like n=1 Tax=Branchiostoma floridae TaxID=7739 RepID=A0A9J7KPY4_BRAFL|nr:ankyrin repeat and SOCS box protein 7-like [Branchiostoma floridae]